jgi:hypothetical protein
MILGQRRHMQRQAISEGHANTLTTQIMTDDAVAKERLVAIGNPMAVTWSRLFSDPHTSGIGSRPGSSR